MADDQTIAVYDAQAETYQKRFSGGSDPAVAAFIAAMPGGAQVLDLGCGPGGASAKMQDAGLIVTAIDASQGMVDSARAQGVPAKLGTFEDIPGLGPFDGVWANFSLLHAPREKLPGYLRAIAHELVPGGIFHIGMKTGEGTKRDSIGRLYTYVGAEALAEMLSDAGFSITSRTNGRTEGLDGTLADWVIYLSTRNA